MGVVLGRRYCVGGRGEGEESVGRKDEGAGRVRPFTAIGKVTLNDNRVGVGSGGQGKGILVRDGGGKSTAGT